MRKIPILALAAVSAFALTAHAQMKDVTIAVIGPITGKEAPFGTQMKMGAEAAVRDLNKAGGVNGMQVKLVVEDDACDPKQAVTAANKVAGMKVAAVIGREFDFTLLRHAAGLDEQVVARPGGIGDELDLDHGGAGVGDGPREGERDLVGVELLPCDARHVPPLPHEGDERRASEVSPHLDHVVDVVAVEAALGGDEHVIASALVELVGEQSGGTVSRPCLLGNELAEGPFGNEDAGRGVVGHGHGQGGLGGTVAEVAARHGAVGLVEPAHLRTDAAAQPAAYQSQARPDVARAEDAGARKAVREEGRALRVGAKP